MPGLPHPDAAQVLEHLILGAAYVQNHRQVQFPGQAQLGFKPGQLGFQGGFGHKAIQPDLAHRHRGAVLQTCAQVRQVFCPGPAHI